MNQPWDGGEEFASSDTEAFVRHMIRVSGKSGAQISRELGKSDNYIWSTLQNMHNGSRVNLHLFVTIANSCGYQIEIKGNGEEYILASDEHELMVCSGYDEVRRQTEAMLKNIRDDERVDALMILDEYCNGYDSDRMAMFAPEGYVSLPNGRGYIFWKSGERTIAFCHHDDVTGEPRVDFVNGLEEIANVQRIRP